MNGYNLRTSKNRSGSTVVLAAVLALVLVMIGLGFFSLTMFFGGARQLKNANDAGTLNIVRKVAGEKKVFLLPTEVTLFGDVAGMYANLTNINRIWAKAFLIGLNANAMTQGQDSASKTYNAAKSITTRLSLYLRLKSNQTDYYSQYANSNPLSMLGLQPKVDTSNTSEWGQAFMDRGAESNIEISKGQLPIGLSNSVRIPTIADPKNQNRNFLIGYKPYDLDGRQYWQVPYPLDERPHLVSGSQFEMNSIISPTWLAPNALSAVGKVKNSANLIQTAKSWAKVNPGIQYKASIPAGFVRIILEAPTYQFKAYGVIPLGVKQAPGFKPSKINYVIPPWYFGFCGVGRVTQYIGNEYIAPLLYFAMFFAPPYAQTMAFDHLAQRVQQINPSYDTPAKLRNKLMLMPISQKPQQQTFFICNIPNPSSDAFYGPDPSLQVVPDYVFKFKDQPEGPMRLLEEKTSFMIPNIGWLDYNCALGPALKSKFPTVSYTKTRYYWQPGTGYNKCLGNLKIEKYTEVYLLYPPCTCIPF